MKKLYLSAVLLFVLSGCGGGGSGSGDSSGQTTTVLEGSWFKACGITLDNITYSTTKLTFSANNFQSETFFYTDAGCSSPFTPLPGGTASGTFTIGNEMTTTGGLLANEIDSIITTQNASSVNIDGYSIFRIANNLLYFGDSSGTLDGTTTALRPDTLDFTRVYDRL